MAGQQMRILYTSTDGIDGKTPVVVSGAYFVPKGTPPAGGWPLAAWAHGTTGVGDTCAPSWNPRSERDASYLNAWLQQGFAIVATDYQGLGTPGPHPYLAVRPEAYSVLDSARAVLKAFPDVANRIVVIGQSQGGGAAFATAGTASDYAPELGIRGSVATGVPYLRPEMLRPGHKTPPDQADPTVAYNLYIEIMMQQRDPSLTADQLVTERARPLFEEARSTCVGQAVTGRSAGRTESGKRAATRVCHCLQGGLADHGIYHNASATAAVRRHRRARPRRAAGVPTGPGAGCLRRGIGGGRSPLRGA